MIRFWAHWNSGIAGKLRLSFGSLFGLIALIIAAWLISLHLADQARNTISSSATIERTVLNMDRSLEKARRLHGDFFLQYGRIGLAEAHVQFAQPSVRLIAEAIATSSELKKMIQQSAVGENLRRHHVDLNLYLASAKRFADTSLESIELITRLAAPERGLEAQFARLSAALQAETAENDELRDLCRELQVFYQEYKISRQRPVMQSAFNVLFNLQQQVDASTALTVGAKETIQGLMGQLRSTGESILATDLAIKNKFNDFTIQTDTVQPIAQTLVQQAAAEMELAQARVAWTLHISAILLAVFTILALCNCLLVTRFIARSITQRIAALSDYAVRLQKGQFHSTAAEQPDDELGQLGQTFNVMSSRIRDLVDDLESKVEQRTLQLAESEQRFRYIANELPNVAIIGFDNDRRVFFWNHACERLYGHNDQEATGQNLEALIAGENQGHVLQESLRQWIDEGTAIPAGETFFRHRDGAPVQVFVSYFRASTPQSQKEMYSIHIDLTDLKKAEEECALRESVYRYLFDYTSSGVGVGEAVDDGRDFIIKDLNRAAEQIEGFRRQDIVGRRLSESFPGAVSTGLLAALRTVWQTGEPLSLPPMLYQDGDKRRWLQGQVYPIPNGETVFVYDDITPLREAELERTAMEAKLQRAQKMEAIGLLAGGVAHDLNNILSGIISYPELILMQLDENSKLRKSVLAIQSSGQRAAAVVADLLTVARGVSSERQACDLNTLVHEYLSSPEHQMRLSLHPGVECSAQLADGLRPLACSPVHIKKSLMNLVTNAAEAIDRTGRIVIGTRNEDLTPAAALNIGVKPGRYVVLEVMDSGAGIAEADIEHIFEPFYTKKVMGRSGTGLGLAVVWNTIQDHKGGIRVTSSTRGTTFTLFFTAAAGLSKPRQDETASTLDHGDGETLLVVDDEPHQRDIATQMLQLLGYKVVTAASGEEAISFMQGHDADLVLLDMLMGTGFNGRQTFEQIITLHPGQKALIVSGFSKDEEVQRALRRGVSGYLQKPYTLKTLGKAVREIFHPERCPE